MERHQEHNEHNEQAPAELEAVRAEKLEELRQSVETEPSDNAERAEAAREVIAKHEHAPQPAPAAEATPQSPIRHFIDHKLNYAQTLAGMQRKLKPVSRSFSKFIHTPIVEKTSEVLESTVARPSVTLGATWTALIVGSAFYFTARHYGYPLSGSELIFAFIVGALLGIALEGIWRAFKRR